jgi:hypothetical protein
MNRLIRLTVVISSLAVMIPGIAFAAAAGNCSAFAAGTCPTSIPSGVNSFYFIDYVGGNDTNSGTTEAAPWQHAPGMANATGNAASHTPTAGEGWIFKGGVTVDYHAYPMNVPWGGAAGQPDYMGYDPAWYAGSSWARPIFNGGGSGGYNAANQSLLTDIAHHSSYVVIDNLEFTGIYFGSACSNSGPYTCGAISQYGYQGSDVSWEIKNVYVHGWSHCSFSGACGDPGNEASLISAKQDARSSIHDTVIDGFDSSKDCCNALASWNEYNNYIAYVDNAEFGEISLFHDNVITNMVTPSNGVHGNCIHLFGSSNMTELIYNNYVSCLNTGTPDEMFLIEETGGATVYAFNNVMVRDGHGSGFEVKNSNTNFFFQNTQECGEDATAGSECVQLYSGASGAATITEKNSVGITTNSNQPTVSNLSGFAGTFNAAPVSGKTCSGGAQNAFGGTQICSPTSTLNINEPYPFAPMNSTDASTIGTASGLAPLCTIIGGINSAAGAACLSDTTLGVAYDSTNHTVSWPNRTPITHSTAGPWQNGAYEFGQSAAAPSAPTGLSAVVN